MIHRLFAASVRAAKISCVGVGGAIAACSAGGTAPPAAESPARIEFRSEALNVFVGEVRVARVSVFDASGNESTAALRWTSLDPTVARVDGDGNVRGVGRGVTEIRAEAGTASAVSPVRVAPPLSLVSPVEDRSGIRYFMNHLVAHEDPPQGPTDYQCGAKAPAGHTGTDFALQDYEAMDARVAVLAAAPGTVVAIHDGEPQFRMNPTPDMKPNYVVLDHGDGLSTRYENLWEGSFRVGVGDDVEAGDSLGTLGNSGNFWVPRLHFEVWFNERLVDPFAGPCSGDTGLWVNPPAYESAFETLRVRVSDYQLQGGGHLSIDVPPSADTLAVGRKFLAWTQVFNPAKGSPSRIRVLDPTGETWLEQQWVQWYEPGLTWYSTFVTLDAGAALGTWTMQYLHEGEVVGRARFVVVER